MENTRIDTYLNKYLSKIVGKDNLVLVCEQILEQKQVDGLDKYSKELLALSLEKQIVKAIEINRISTHSTSYWNSFKVSVPLIYNDNNVLKEYLNLYIVKKDEINKNDNEIIKQIDKFYNDLIDNRKANFVNKMFCLPSGRRVSINDCLNAIKSALNNTKEIEYVISNTSRKAKGAIIAAGMASSLAASIISFNAKSNNKVEGVIAIENENKNEYVNDDIELEVGALKELNDNIVNMPKMMASEKEEPEEIQKQEVKEEKVFRGYEIEGLSFEENAKVREYQEIIYEKSKKYNVPFNVMMVILDNESGGRYHTNGVINNSNSNGTVDYGLFQINSVNFEEIEEKLKISKEELLNDPEKNIEASCYLVSKIIEKYGKQHEEDLKNKDYTFIFGVYNGGGDYRIIESDAARNYAAKAQQKVNEIFNLEDDELFDVIYVYDNGIVEDGEHVKTR